MVSWMGALGAAIFLGPGAALTINPAHKSKCSIRELQPLLMGHASHVFPIGVLDLKDPVRIFDHEPAPPHSLLKLFNDLFSRRTTASLFYTNDVKVLIDIIVRNISDLSPGDKRRQQYLELCRRVMRNS
ncbi:hypothetical protein NQ317_013676 [Molorchus minor]|uniref:SPIN90/Ldb17 leucine-rich domain-containing protein n=1 Tax=Molorchus minor TaxID=1323400 RepID=A0ABQ9JAR9_9CUCU|nr:hypothetical protein NQ317_013676 [Molorchus minor]